MLSKKDLVELNKEFGNGVVVNGNSLDYAIQTNLCSKNWLRSAAIFTRAILIDHIFEDGNKRTTAAVIMALMELNKVDYDKEKIPHIITHILKKNMTKISEIERCIKDGFS